MKAIIMAGGEGTRLRPLTCDCPKPMMRLMDRPVIEYSLELLARHGVKEAAVTLGYLPERIRDHLGENCCGISLNYYTERTPLGTAGGVKQAKDFLTETFCVLSGDGVTDCDLSAALEFHRNRHALATMVLKCTSDPTEYGLVLTDAAGCVRSFLEKPSWGEVVTDSVNTGIYILEPEILDMIPDGPYDFGSELFPLLAAKGVLYGWVMNGYWCDIGDIPAYLATCRDALSGAIDLPGMGCGKSIISPDAHISDAAVLESPCYIGPDAHISSGARIGAGSMIGAGAYIGEDAGIKRSIVWPGAEIGSGAQLRGCVIGRNASVSPWARVYENSALGTGATIGADAEIAPGISVWPGKNVSEATLIDSNLVWGAASAGCFCDGGICLTSPADATHAAQAVAAALRPSEVLLARSASAVAPAMWHSAAAGLMAQGVRILDAGICTAPQLRYALALMHADCGILATGTGLMPLTRDGTRLSRPLQRKVCALLSRRDYPRPFTHEPQPVVYSGRSEPAYTAMLASAFTADPALTPPATVCCVSQHVLSLAEKVFRRIGVFARFVQEEAYMELMPGETGILLSPDGSEVQFSHVNGILTDPQHELLQAWTALERGERTVITAERVTRAMEELCSRYSAKLRRTGTSRESLEEALLESPLQLRLETDGIFFAVCVLSALTESARSLTGWLSTMPKIHRMERVVHMDNSTRGRALRDFSTGSACDGLAMDRGDAYAWIAPDNDRPECRIVSEAYTMEAARELCDFCESELKKAMGANESP